MNDQTEEPDQSDSRADYFRRYRAARKILGRAFPPYKDKRVGTRQGDRHKPGYQPPKRKARPHVEKFRRLKFVGWDGEGIGHPRNKYVMLSNSKGDCLRGDDLQSYEIFEFLLDHRATANTIHCVYGAVYDFTHWFLALDDELKRQLHRTGRCMWKPLVPGYKRKRKIYLIEYTPRKRFSVEDRTNWDKKTVWDSETDWKKRNRKHWRRIEVWDVIGFFQQTFVSTLHKWNVGTTEQRAHISAMKKQRGVFTEQQEADILAYNFLECELLQEVMEKLHALLLSNPLPGANPDEIWLPIRRWDGAGAIAAALYKREGMKLHLGSATEKRYGQFCPDWHYQSKSQQAEIEYALRCAYFGGRIECFKRGRACAPGFDLDVKSAYPAAMIDLPSFAQGGKWEWVDQFDSQAFGVWRTEWNAVTESHPVLPLPFRLHSGGAVLFPEMGAGWYHTVEVSAALADERNHVQVSGGWIWTPATSHKPFAFIQRYFDARLYLQSLGHPAEKIIKLALNSLYGKTAQTLGSILEEWECELELPDQSRTEDYIGDCDLDKIFFKTATYYNLAWAGAITAHCRATIYQQAMKWEPWVAMIQTDGLFCTVPVGESMPEIRQENQLGGFEVVEYLDSLIVQAGVYYLGSYDQDGIFSWNPDKRKTRGFTADDVAVQEILDAWKRADRLELTYTSSPRFQTVGYCMNKKDFGQLACWHPQERKLNLYVDSKRTSIDGFIRNSDFDRIMKRKCKALRLHTQQLPTINLLNTDYLAGCPSRPCNPKWREKLHENGDDDMALTEAMIEGDDFNDNFKAEIMAKYDFD